jgi:two-component system, chemotaxis family, CheB/CheR fusion protein
MKPKKSAQKKTRNEKVESRTVQEALFPLVGIGASAGGLEAFEKFFPQLPTNIGMAFILVPHLDPGHASMMTDLLRRATKLEVKEAEDGEKVLPNHIYVIPPNKEMAIKQRTLNLGPLQRTQGVRMPIDAFLRSLAEDAGEMAIGIILSGTGTDGTLGIRAIRGAGGTVMAQTPSSAKYPGMPQSAVQTGLVDFVLPPDKMPSQLMSLSKQMGRQTKLPATREDRLRKILGLVRAQTGCDFSFYKKTTVNRRAEKRMNLHGLGTHSAYLNFLQEHPEEVSLLFKEMLIGVTHFFRDPEAFQALGKRVLKYLQDHPKAAGFRVWVPACSTGEEAYSIAMLIMECLDESKRDIKIQVFGTDIDPEAINFARNGIYAENISADVNPDRLKRFFVREENGLRVKKEIREAIVFAVQDVTKDPPFTKLDLLSCRNLLIYLELELQNRLLPMFHYSLNPGGLLFLGTAETNGKHADLFGVNDKKWRIYETKGKLAPVYEEEWRGFPWAEVQPPLVMGAEPQKTKEMDIASAAQKALLETFAPASVIVNAKGEILYIHGQTGKYLEPAQGRPNWNIFDMVRKGIQFEVRSGIHYALTRRKERKYAKLQVKTDHEYQPVNLTVKPFTPAKAAKDLVMVIFEEVAEREKPKPGSKGRKSPNETDERLKEAERELLFTRETLQATVEELQATNEELKSANEEMQSTNEELQSTNEELETSREELQSTNEELITVNSELQGKVDQLSLAESDIKLLLENTRLGIIFLDTHLRINRFTAEVKKAFNLIASDVGRPLHDIRSNLHRDDIEKDAEKVLQSLQSEEREVQTKDGEWYLMKVVPYRSAENTILGVVLTFTDISEVKRANEFAAGIVETVREPLLVLDGGLKVRFANRAFYRTFKVSAEETAKRLIYELGNGQWNLPELRRLLGEILPQNNTFEDYRVEHDFPGIGRKRMLLNGRRIIGRGGAEGAMILLAIEDVTRRESLRKERGASD